MVKAAEDGKDPGEKAKAIESKRVVTAAKYKDAVLKRDAFLEALGNVYRLVAAETHKGLPKWHDAMLKARQERTAQVAPVLTEAVKALLPLMSEALTLAGHVESAREGLGAEGAAPESPTDTAALSQALSALEGAPSLWGQFATDPVLSLDAEHYAKAHVAPMDWDAFNKRADAIEAYRQHFKRDPRDGGGDLTYEEAAAMVDGPLKDRFGTGFSGY
ncbi:hypothetical protein ACFVT6_35150 [Streptomyces sp. NPDC058049]|uniref:hypothetical protein n=2 Tax=Streptomyces TaxID=1883 RepID=UPI0036E34BC4